MRSSTIQNRYRFILAFLLSLIVGCSSSTYNGTSKRNDSKLNPQDQRQFDEFFLKGTTYLMTENYDEALRYLQAAHRLRPNSPSVHHALGKVFEHRGEHDSAVAYYQHTLRLLPGLHAVRKDLANALTNQGEFDSAAREFMKLLISTPDDLQGQFMVARTLHRRNPDRALVYYEYIRDNIVENFDVLINLYELYVERNDIAAATETAELLLQLHPQNADFYDLLCDSYIDANRFDEAVGLALHASRFLDDDRKMQVFLRLQLTSLMNRQEAGSEEYEVGLNRFTRELVKLSIDRGGDDRRLLHVAGNGAIAIGDIEDANSILRRAFASTELSGSDWVESAELYLEASEPRQLLSTLGEYSKRYGDDANVAYVMGNVHALLNQEQRSVEYLEKAVSVDPNHVEAWSKVCGLHLVSGRMDESRRCFERSLELNQDSPSLLHGYSQLLLSAGEFERSEALVDRAIQLDIGNPGYSATKGELAYLRGEYNVALRYLRKAVRDDGVRAEWLEDLGDTYLAVDNIKKAREAYQRGLLIAGRNSYVLKSLQDKIEGLEN